MSQKKILTEEKDLTDNGIRLNKYLSDSGICSRRGADKLIENGKIIVNGKTALMGQRIKKGDKVVYEGREIKLYEKLILLAFNKPRGIECTTNTDTKNNLIDYLNYGRKVFYIGRLDKDSHGLLLLTNDGDLCNLIAKSVNHHEKEYIVRVNKKIDNDFIQKMSGGVQILDTTTKKCKVKKIDDYTFNIILTQGLNRQIRRMCEALSYKVIDLKRIRVMNIKLSNLPEGTYREVSSEEYDTLRKNLKNNKLGEKNESGK